MHGRGLDPDTIAQLGTSLRFNYALASLFRALAGMSVVAMLMSAERREAHMRIASARQSAADSVIDLRVMGGKTVLIVDDDEDVREGMIDLLEDEGFDVVSARHGAEALDQLRGGLAPNVIVLDVMMPVMGGREFRALQLADDDLATIPVILCSADARAEIPGPRVTPLPKPFGLDQLLVALERAMKGAA